MKSLITLLLTFISVSFSFINATGHFYKRNQCSRQLQIALHKPETCAYKYLSKISEIFKARSQVLFTSTSEADSFIYTFENTFNVLVSLANPFGKYTNYYPNGTKQPGQPAKYTDTAQSYLNFPGFVRQISSQEFYYTFNVFSTDGQYYDITLSMPLSRDPIVC